MLKSCLPALSSYLTLSQVSLLLLSSHCSRILTVPPKGQFKLFSHMEFSHEQFCPSRPFFSSSFTQPMLFHLGKTSYMPSQFPEISHSTYHNSTSFMSVLSLSHVRLFATPWTAARQASLSIPNSWSPLKPMCIESVIPSNHLILCPPLLLPSIFPSIRVFSNESALRIRWPKYWSFSSTSVLPMNIRD